MRYSESYPDSGGITWETCTLRSWLNADFLDAAFSDNEQAQILSVTVSTKDNGLERTKGGNDTTDRVFILSAEEVAAYFSSDEERCPGATEHIKEKANAVKWWIRTPGRTQYYAALVSPNSIVFGSGIDLNGDGIGSFYAVRPAYVDQLM